MSPPNKSVVQNPHYRMAGDEGVAIGRAGTQGGWYEFAATFCVAHEVLDVGCGLGKGLEILARVARKATGIDQDERLERPGIIKMDLSEVPSKSVDTVVCIDVIEHVEDDHSFVQDLVRVARQQILLSTPNYTASRCQWPYHVREYMPHELNALFADQREVHMYKGRQFGDLRYKVTHYSAYVMLNKLRVNPTTGLLTRCYNKLLPVPARIHSHLFLRVVVAEV